ncbi:3-keto-5-aminohexanoate cleavage protein [Pseudonocardia sp. TRM90224]|uniref:3-keto-5-aminohexanoate cleavage protein n=1 Tax=Pseudonocardia sp. TRM90224 TaxID=2812678 RepID=UPI001E4960E2|nr:3-keto-5-aminohexanoate cleavage protein [Pseudonocardia sp. TRM90224]
MLQAVLNGSRPEDAHPALPVLARHLARDARAVAREGITAVHVHPRGPNAQETLDPMHVGDAVAAIRAEVPGMEIGVTTGRWIQPDPTKRIEAVLAWGHLGVGKPDVCSVNVHEKGWVDVCAAAASVGIGVELGVWTSGDAVTLRTNGVPPGTTRVLAESTVSDPETAVAEGVRIMRALGNELGVPVLLHGEEGGAWPVLEYAMRMELDTRIGFEDVLVLPNGWLATGNEHLVATAFEIEKKQSWQSPGRSRIGRRAPN